MTKEEFSKSYWTVQLYGNSVVFVLLIGFTTIAVMCAGPLGNLVRSHFKDEGVVGAIGGLIFGISLVACCLLSLLPFRWIDRRFGVTCPSCKRSLTLRCARAKVLRTGSCCLCHEPLLKAWDQVDQVR